MWQNPLFRKSQSVVKIIVPYYDANLISQQLRPTKLVIENQNIKLNAIANKIHFLIYNSLMKNYNQLCS